MDFALVPARLVLGWHLKIGHNCFNWHLFQFTIQKHRTYHSTLKHTTQLEKRC